MSPMIHFTTTLGAFLTMALIFTNYYKKFNTDVFQRKLLLLMLYTALTAVFTDFAGRFIEGRAGAAFRYLMYTDISLHIIAKNCAYYAGVIFIDYFAHKSIKRTNKIIKAVVIILIIYSVSVIINLFFGYYFTVTPDNRNMDGSMYILRVIFSYCAVIIITVDVLLSSKYFRHSHAYLVIVFVLLSGTGSTIDILIRSSSLAWPCFAAAVLYIYFFIIQADSKIDSLTQIGNRASFNEFIDKLSRQNTKKDYSIVMIDMDKFKEINDTIGHLEGDNALRDLAAIIKGCIRYSDYAARYGGDEFVLVAEAEYDIRRLMDRILDSISQQNDMRIRPYQLYISYGYDVYTTNSGQSIYEFLAKIDAMMYKQKEERKKAGIPSSITAELPARENEE